MAVDILLPQDCLSQGQLFCDQSLLTLTLNPNDSIFHPRKQPSDPAGFWQGCRSVAAKPPIRDTVMEEVKIFSGECNKLDVSLDDGVNRMIVSGKNGSKDVAIGMTKRLGPEPETMVKRVPSPRAAKRFGERTDRVIRTTRRHSPRPEMLKRRVSNPKRKALEGTTYAGPAINSASPAPRVLPHPSSGLCRFFAT